MSPFQKSEFEKMLNEWKEGQLSTQEVIDRVEAYSSASNSVKLPVSGRSEQLAFCLKCGMPKHPVTGAQCLDADCIGKVKS